MQKIVLSNGVKMAILGFGVFQIDTGTSLFFDHRDPAMVKLLSKAKRNT